ncbi:MAG: winged helix-turn-helix domain-containing protein [Planctomycetota bacterium]|jgi:hypothetical protein|nr:winged helix-turn-helix domain-containing protein [Planctomycetota bacterium]
MATNATTNTSKKTASKKATKKTASKKAAKKAPAKKAAPKKAKEKRPSGLDAAVKVLSEVGEPMNCKDIVDRALEKGYWKTNGKTPHATVYSAILREIQKKGKDARFKKTERGKFALNG